MGGPPADELTSEQRAEFSDALVRLRDELKHQIASSADGASSVALDKPIGRISRIDAIAQQKMLQTNRQAAKLRLQQAEAALSRIAEDEYGECLECGEPVGSARLEVKPEASFCIGCQSSHESRGR